MNDARWEGGLAIVQSLHNSGFEAYLVGGCVRDRLLGRPLVDVDIATSALPEQVAALFPRTIPTGLQHGTVTVLQDGHSYEVTTFRTESDYTDARRPDRVHYVRNIREDLARRDFTINAMACGLHDELIDEYGGLADLKRRIIRCVGDPVQRFGEDALRMVRAIRFAAALDFHIAKSVWRGVREQGPRLRLVAMERIGTEWDKMMASAHPARACALLLRSGLLRHLKEPLPDAVVNMQISQALLRLDQLAEVDIRWMALCSAAGLDGEQAAACCRTLRMSGKRAAKIAAAVAFGRSISAEASAVEREAFLVRVLQFGRSAAADWLAYSDAGKQYRTWLDELQLDSVAQLAVKGDELARRLNRKPGPWLAHLLRKLLEAAALGRVVNERTALLEAASSYMTTSGRMKTNGAEDRR